MDALEYMFLQDSQVVSLVIKIINEQKPLGKIVDIDWKSQILFLFLNTLKVFIPMSIRLVFHEVSLPKEAKLGIEIFLE